LPGLDDNKRGAGREQVPAAVRARILALTRTTRPVATGLSHWSSRELAKYLKRSDGITVSWHYVATDEILAKVRWVETKVMQLVANNSDNTSSLTRH
jgi:hypothetical protein